MSPQEFEVAVKRHERRRDVFMEEGLSEKEAFHLADLMMDRDNDSMDDRRLCFECQNYQDKLCIKMKDKYGKPDKPLRFVLQRCEMFQLKETKK